MMSSVGNKLLQYTYCPLSQEVKATREWNLFSYLNITSGIFFLKHYTQNGMKNIVSDHFRKKLKLSISLDQQIENL